MLRQLKHLLVSVETVETLVGESVGRIVMCRAISGNTTISSSFHSSSKQIEIGDSLLYGYVLVAFFFVCNTENSALIK